jgi:plastocyanin
MKKVRFSFLAPILLLLPGIGLGAEGMGKTGIVKGTVTLDGRPTSAVVVSVEGLSKEYLRSHVSKAVPKLMDQKGMKFIPEVLPVLVGTSVEFPNHDNTWHNVFSPSETNKFNLGLYPPSEKRSVTLTEAGVVRILCNVHPNMEAHIVVKEHSLFTTPNTRGSYRIDAVPMGKYRLEVWHPDVGAKVQPFNMVREGEVLNIDINLRRSQ